jgi:hypothetical protein
MPRLFRILVLDLTHFPSASVSLCIGGRWISFKLFLPSRVFFPERLSALLATVSLLRLMVCKDVSLTIIICRRVSSRSTLIHIPCSFVNLTFRRTKWCWNCPGPLRRRPTIGRLLVLRKHSKSAIAMGTALAGTLPSALSGSANSLLRCKSALAWQRLLAILTKRTTMTLLTKLATMIRMATRTIKMTTIKTAIKTATIKTATIKTGTIQMATIKMTTTPTVPSKSNRLPKGAPLLQASQRARSQGQQGRPLQGREHAQLPRLCRCQQSRRDRTSSRSSALTTFDTAPRLAASSTSSDGSGLATQTAPGSQLDL